MEIYIDSNLDEELPEFQSLRPAKYLPLPIKSVACSDALSTDSDDDAPYVPLSFRLKLQQQQQQLQQQQQQQDKRRDNPSCSSEGSLKRFANIVHPQHQNSHIHEGLGKSNAPKRTPEEIQRSKEEALRRKKLREEQQRSKEAQRSGKEEEKPQTKAMAEEVKALRPKECIKNMVAVVDPDNPSCSSEGSLKRFANIVHPQHQNSHIHEGLGKSNAPKRTPEEIQRSKEEALRRKKLREEQQRSKEAQRSGKEEEKPQTKAMAEEVKALRPKECIKNMVAVVDPDSPSCSSEGSLKRFANIVHPQHQNSHIHEGLGKSNAPKRTPEEIQRSKEEALRRKKLREEQQRSKEAQRSGKEEEKPQTKAMAEEVKALRPKECIKNMVAVVDPDNPSCSPEGSLKRFANIVHPQHQNSHIHEGLGKSNAPKRTPEEIQRSKEEALRRKKLREEQQRSKEAQRSGKEEEKPQTKAMAEEVKALRPKECIKNMVAVVDPDNPSCSSEGSLKRFANIVHPQHQNSHIHEGLGKSKAPKRTAEEIQTSKEEALSRKKPREEQQRSKEAQRSGKEEEKAQRKAMAEAVKALRPKECIKYMVAVVDPVLLQLEGGGGALLSSLQAMGCTCAIEKQPLPHSVGWRRRTPGIQATDGDCVPEKEVVIHMDVEGFILLIHSYIQEKQMGWSEYGRNLTTWVQDLQRRNPKKVLSLVILGVEEYFRSHKAQSQKKLREAVVGKEQGGAKWRKKTGAAGTLPELSRIQVEEAMVDLQIHTGVCVHFLSTWKDFTEHIKRATKAVAEAPFKRERDHNNGFSFCLESKWAGGHRVERCGKGLLQVWRRQVQQLHMVSADMASAVVASYPSPWLLTKAYNSCRTEKDKLAVLSEIQIRRGEGVTSTVRRLGPELSRRMRMLLTSANPESTLGSNA